MHTIRILQNPMVKWDHTGLSITKVKLSMKKIKNVIAK